MSTSDDATLLSDLKALCQYLMKKSSEDALRLDV